MFYRLLAAMTLMLVSPSGLGASELRPLIPVGEVVADVMTLTLTPRAQELTRRFREAISRDPEWFKAYVAAAPAGEALPYSERFGLSAAEYLELKTSVEKQTLAKTGEARLSFKVQGEGRIVIESPDLPDVNGVAIDFASNRVQTSYGPLETRTEIDNGDADSPTGVWSGSQWSVERHDEAMTQGVIAKFALGRLKTSGRLILYFSAKEMRGAKLSRRTDLILYFNARSGSV